MIFTVIGGPTSAGKSEIAMEAARRLKNAEIISADAFQVYKGFDIGTNKPSMADRLEVPHHLIDINEPSQAYTAGLFAESAERILEDVVARGKIPLIVGGTGLYIKSLTEGIFDCPPVEAGIRLALEERKAAEGLRPLYEELQKLDPEYAAKISENDPVRIIRALEVCIGLKIPFTQAHKIYDKPAKYSYRIFVPLVERKRLYMGINERARLMWDLGWPEETEKILSSGAKEDWPAFRAIGYKYAAAFLRGETSAAEAIGDIARDTRHFAKRQTTWFKTVKNVLYYEDKNRMLEDVIESGEGIFCES